MTQTIDELWQLTQQPGFDCDARAEQAERLWAQHDARALRDAFFVAFRVVEELAGGTSEQPMGVVPPAPPAKVYAPTGEPQGEAAAHATWNAIAALTTEAHLGVDDPLLADQIKNLARVHRDVGVYMLGWWAWSAFAQIATSRPAADVQAAQQRISAALAQLG